MNGFASKMDVLNQNSRLTTEGSVLRAERQIRRVCHQRERTGARGAVRVSAGSAISASDGKAPTQELECLDWFEPLIDRPPQARVPQDTARGAVRGSARRSKGSREGRPSARTNERTGGGHERARWKRPRNGTRLSRLNRCCRHPPYRGASLIRNTHPPMITIGP